MAIRDPYEVLGVSRNAGKDEIKSAYRRLARLHHPDVNPNDPTAEEKFKEIGEAYAILGDEERRARFDQYGTTDDQPNPGDFFGGGGISDIFDAFFGGGNPGGQSARRRNGRDGEDVQSSVVISLADVLTGVRSKVKYKRAAKCTACSGNGTESGAPPETCGTCKGHGVVASVRNTFLGQVRTQSTCPTCRGEGTVIANPCRMCRGAKFVEATNEQEVAIPAGVESGSTMRVPGLGGDGLGAGRPGDLYVNIEVEDDGRFERRGTSLFTLLEVSIAQAALGDEIQLAGVDKPVTVQIPSGTQPGTPIVLKGEGLPPLHGGRRGDMAVQINVTIPTDLSEAQAKHLREFAEMRGESVPKGQDSGGFLGGLFGRKK